MNFTSWRDGADAVSYDVPWRSVSSVGIPRSLKMLGFRPFQCELLGPAGRSHGGVWQIGVGSFILLGAEFQAFRGNGWREALHSRSLVRHFEIYPQKGAGRGAQAPGLAAAARASVGVSSRRPWEGGQCTARRPHAPSWNRRSRGPRTPQDIGGWGRRCAC